MSIPIKSDKSGPGRPRKRETLFYKYIKPYNIKIVYSLKVSTQTTTRDRFNTREQEKWVVEHDRQTRVGILINVGEDVPNGGETFEKMVKSAKRINNYRNTNRRFICKIKDNDTGVEFFINLWNVELDDDILDRIYTDFFIPSGWVVKRKNIMDTIGYNLETVNHIRKANAQKRKIERKKTDVDNFLKWCEENIGTSKNKKGAKEDSIEAMIQFHKRRIIEESTKLEVLREYWSGIPKDKRTI